MKVLSPAIQAFPSSFCSNADDLGVDLLTIDGHKMYAPKDVGALYIRRGVTIDSLVHGTEQEMGKRAGTKNVPYIAGLRAR